MDSNENAHASLLPISRPTRLPVPDKLSEVPASVSNARSATSMLPPPPGTLKRKTLMERAGEPVRPSPAAPVSRSASTTVKANSISQLSRQPSVAAASTTTVPASYRSASNGSFASSIGGIRPPSAQSYRAKTIQPPARPGTSFDTFPRIQNRSIVSVNANNTMWDSESRLDHVESLYSELKESMQSTTVETTGLKETISLLKARVTELETIRSQLGITNSTLQRDLDGARAELAVASRSLDDAIRKKNIEVDDMERKYRRDLDQASRDAEDDSRRMNRQHQDEIAHLRKKLEDALEDEKEKRRKEVQALSSEGTMAQQRVEAELESREKQLRTLQDDLLRSQAETNTQQTMNRELQAKLSEAAAHAISLEASLRSMKAQVEFLESDSKSQSNAFTDLEQKTQNAIKEAEVAREKLRVEETLRRKLHNQIQELKGNIRVFCRVRPALSSDVSDGSAKILFPDDNTDSKELEVMGPEEKSSLGTVTTRKNAFSFDRVFTPAAQNADVFDEISQLVQSALDGYNVCIFCYGQTGAGKTFTMSSDDGMIPRATRQIYETSKALEEKGWKYSMEGSFVEVYNENINDLLGNADQFDKKKHEIRHDMQRCKTTITDITTVDLDTADKVDVILKRAMGNRSMAATKANERSSRSHSVFILKLIGENHVTGERSEGTLNLVDLAGSERLSHSEATGARLKETQNINKSLSCLGDVIGALGQGKEGGHVPYRNSKLTYLLQFSLGGNSKTLMFVMISPLQAHLSETLTSLKFATKVHNTHIGTARRQSKIKD